LRNGLSIEHPKLLGQKKAPNRSGAADWPLFDAMQSRDGASYVIQHNFIDTQSLGGTSHENTLDALRARSSREHDCGGKRLRPYDGQTAHAGRVEL
jgi:hypothetical protein